MRTSRASWIGIGLLAFAIGCQTVKVVRPDSGGTLAPAYDIDEGSTLDLVIDPGNTNSATVTSTLPPNATFQNGVFSFAPSFSQAGLYTVTFHAASGPLTIAIRVHNVIHIDQPPLTVVSEGSAATVVTFTSDDPPGTSVVYSADVSGAPGATFDPVAHTLSFAPSWRFLDSRASAVVIPVTAQGQELDSGILRTSTVDAVYQVKEATSFSQEIVPMFLLPIGSTGGANPQFESVEGRNCMSAGCHDGQATDPASLDLRPFAIYSSLVNKSPAPDGINGSTCGGLASNIKYVVPGDPTLSLWYMKISGTDGSGAVGPPCGVQQSTNQPFNYYTVTDEDAWRACPPADSNCRSALDCSATDIACKTNARLVRKARLWILAGAPNN